MAVKGHSTTFEYGNAATYTASTTWTPLAGVVSVTPPTIESDDIDISTMSSADQFKETDGGWSDGGELEVQVQFEDDQAETVYGLFNQNKGFRITFSNGASWKCNGRIKSYGDEVEREGLVTTTIKVKVSGKPLFQKAA